MNRLFRHKTSLLLLLAMLFTQGGHLSSLTAVVHGLEVDTTHSHAEQSFHQTAGIYHQHLQQAPDHVHDTPQLSSGNGTTIQTPATEQTDNYLFHPPAEPLYRIERPPRLMA